MAMTGEQKRQAAIYVLRTLATRGQDKMWLQERTGLDPATLRTFLAGETFPQTAKRYAIEDALGVARGSIELAARGLIEEEREPQGDPVERAIAESPLTRANRAKLIGYYYELLDAQQGRGSA